MHLKFKNVRMSLFILVFSFLAASLLAFAEARQAKTVAPAPKDYRIHLGAYVFDPLKAAPEIPKALRIAEPPKEAAYYIVQFTKSLTKEERAEVQGKYGLRLTEYIANLSYLEKLRPETVARLGRFKPFRWAGLYQPAFKIDPRIGKLKFVSKARKAESGTLLSITAFKDASLEELAESLRKFGFEVMAVTKDEKPGIRRLKIRAGSPGDAEKIAGLPGVKYIEEIGDVTLNNGVTSWVIQTNVNNSRTVWGHGLRGEGQIIGHIDGALDINHCFYRDPVDNTVRPAHRKVVGLRNAAGGTTDQAHGTFTAGNAAGEDFNNDAYSVAPNANNGNAPRARISHSYLYDLTWLGGTVSFYNDLAQAHTDGACIHNNSWDDKSTSAYTQLSVDLDQFTWDHEDDLVLVAPDNHGTIRPPDTSKNALVVNATQLQPNQGNFSSGIKQFTLDGRRKPDLMAPGDGIVSADSGTACGTLGASGTSAAAPAVAGAAALVRQYYTEGWYPTGTKQPDHGFTPSGSLLKATLLNATVDAAGIAGYPGGVASGEGWGRLLLENGLYFAGDARNLRVWDFRNEDGLYTGQTRTHHIDVDTNGQPLKVTLVWTEPPASSGSAAPVVNDLDLTVVSPGGAQTFLGNVFAAGVSAAGGAADTLNNVEMVLVNAPAPGDWTITVTGTAVNVGNPAQGYALVVTADMPEPPAPTGNQDTLVVRVKFNDIAYEPPLPNLQNLMTDVVAYTSEVSYGQATVLPEYRGAILLDHPKDYYYHPSRNLLVELTQEVVDKLVAADNAVFDKGTANPADDIDRMIVVTNDVNFSEDWATTGPWPYDMPAGFTRPISVSIQSYANIEARFNHGLGHQFGLVDLYAHPGVLFARDYVDEWDNMAGLFNNVHSLIWNKDRAGWVTAHGSQITYIARPAAGTAPPPQTYQLFDQESTAVNLKGIAIGLTDRAATPAAEDVFYYVEARNNALGGYDNGLPASGVLIYYVNELIPQGEGPVILRDKNPGTATLADAAFAIGDSTTIPGLNITIEVLAPTAAGGACDIRVTYAPPATDYNLYITRGDTIGGQFYSYFSPDIWIDSPKNGWNLSAGPPPPGQEESPVVGMENRIYARIHNGGAGMAYDFDVRFRVSEPYHTVGGEADFNHFVGIKHVASLDRTEGAAPPAAPLILFMPWTPDDDGHPHTCAWVDLINLVGTDTNLYDNGAQENLTKVTSLTSSPFHPVTYSYTLKNSYDRQALFYFRAEDVPQGWTAVLNPKKVLLDPGERVEGSATITPPPDAEVCTSQRIQITSWTPRGDTIIPVGGGVVQVDLRNPGRLNYETTVEPCRRKEMALMSSAVAAAPCYTIKTRGCTEPPLPNQDIILKYTDPLGNPVYRTVRTDEHGCFEDFYVNAQGGVWQVDAEFPGEQCIGPIEPPTQVVVIPPSPPRPVKGLGYSFHLGMNFPLGRFDTEFDPGPSLTLDLDYPLTDRLLLLGLFGFHYFHGKGSDLTWSSLSINAKFYVPFYSWRWYVNGGFGLYHPNSGSNQMGLNLGTGLNFPIQPGLSLDLGMDYHLVDPGGVKRAFLDMKMGMIFRF